MADNNYIFPDSDELERIYLEKLKNAGSKDREKKDAAKPAEKSVSNDPIDAHEYKDPEKKSPEVYEKMVSDIEKNRSERSKSYWTDTPVNPAGKSFWLKDEEQKKKEPEPVREPEQKPKAERSMTKRTIEIKISEKNQKKLAPPPIPLEEALHPVTGESGSVRRERPRRPVTDEGEPVRREGARRPVTEEGEPVRRERPRRPATEEGEPVRREQPRRPAREMQSPMIPDELGQEGMTADERRTAEAIERVRSAAVRDIEVPGDNGRGAPPRPPRRKKKSKIKKYENEFNFINAAICILMVFGVGIALVVMKRDSGFIESENRNLAEFPSFSLSSWFKGDFTGGIVNYYTDTIPGREKLRSLSKTFTDLFGIKSDDVDIINNTGSKTENEKVDEEKKATTTKATVYTGPRETTTTTEVPAGNDSEPASETTLATKKKLEVPNEGEMLNSVIVTGKGTPEVRAMSIFGGIFDIGTRYANVLNNYKQMVGETVNIYNMSVPLASAYYTPKNMEGIYSDQHECIENIGVSLNNVINVDVFDTLHDHADEYIYFRTDHHWQPLGAYYAAQQFAQEAQVPFPDISTYEKKTIEDFTGSMYGYTNYLEDLKTWPDLLTYYKPTNQYTVTYYDETFSNPYEGSLFFEDNEWTQNYSVILGGDMNIAEIKTDVGNGRTLVLIKNSYGNALVPFFVGSFEKIYVVDFRYVLVGMNDFFKKVGATDVLFGMAIFSCYSDDHVSMIENLMY